MSRLDESTSWQAVCERRNDLSTPFYYAVSSTGIYCLPHCPARRPRRENVSFFDSPLQAEQAGFRACQRCRPNQPDRGGQAVIEICRYLENCSDLPSSAELARRAGLSAHHFHRLFLKQTGSTPGAYLRALRMQRLRQVLPACQGVTEACYEAGFGSSAGFYAQASSGLGMSPSVYRKGGRGLDLSYAVGACWLGWFLVARTPRGICAVLLGDSPAQLKEQLQLQFPAVRSLSEEPQLLLLLQPVVESLKACPTLPLDLQGTLFQHRVWQALQQIPPGATISYSQLAARLGRPEAVRAVARACAHNPAAIVVPCHRVLGSDGQLKGYRWGQQRKAALLQRETSAAEHATDLTEQPAAASALEGALELSRHGSR